MTIMIETSFSDFPLAPEEDNRKYKGSFRGQFKALVMKNYSLQKKQMGTNICQVK